MQLIVFLVLLLVASVVVGSHNAAWLDGARRIAVLAAALSVLIGVIAWTITALSPEIPLGLPAKVWYPLGGLLGGIALAAAAGRRARGIAADKAARAARAFTFRPGPDSH